MSSRVALSSEGLGVSAQRYSEVRKPTETLCDPLRQEDYVVQSMPDVSPIKWHLAHTSWFFETFVLAARLPGYRPVHRQFRLLFNSYYNSIGEPFPREKRGLLTRPTVDEVYAYRAAVDERMSRLLDGGGDLTEEEASIVELGLQHEQQHQELILTDIKHVFFSNPLLPVYGGGHADPAFGPPSPQRWIEYPEGLRFVGHAGSSFSFDNERPRHRVFQHAFRLARRAVTNGEYLDFVRDRGYARPELWLADGWTVVLSEKWRSPLYWLERDGEWWEFTLGGLQRLNPAAPVCHVSYFEADAFATWAGDRLPTEEEWEVAAWSLPVQGHFVESGRLHPAAAPERPGPVHTLLQMYGDVWEWTRSAYAPYPGFRAANGALGEYNGKFMCGQYVLRGGSCATPGSHIRPSYRNFFYPHQRWQFTGIRLAQGPEPTT